MASRLFLLAVGGAIGIFHPSAAMAPGTATRWFHGREDHPGWPGARSDHQLGSRQRSEDESRGPDETAAAGDSVEARRLAVRAEPDEKCDDTERGWIIFGLVFMGLLTAASMTSGFLLANLPTTHTLQTVNGEVNGGRLKCASLMWWIVGLPFGATYAVWLVDGAVCCRPLQPTATAQPER